MPTGAQNFPQNNRKVDEGGTTFLCEGRLLALFLDRDNVARQQSGEREGKTCMTGPRIRLKLGPYVI